MSFIIVGLWWQLLLSAANPRYRASVSPLKHSHRDFQKVCVTIWCKNSPFCLFKILSQFTFIPTYQEYHMIKVFSTFVMVETVESFSEVHKCDNCLQVMTFNSFDKSFMREFSTVVDVPSLIQAKMLFSLWTDLLSSILFASFAHIEHRSIPP